MAAPAAVETLLERVESLLDGGDTPAVIDILRRLHPADSSEVLYRLSPDFQKLILQELPWEEVADVLEELNEEEMVEVVQGLTVAELADVLDEMEPDMAADLIGELLYRVVDIAWTERGKPENCSCLRSSEQSSLRADLRQCDRAQQEAISRGRNSF